MTNLTHKVKTAILKYNLCRPGGHLLLAVSGGADSIALLRLMHAIAPQSRLRLTMAHLHHGLRGAAADADAAFVQAAARQLRLPCVLVRTNVRRRARRQGISLEMAGRAARYEFFARAAQRLHCDAVAVAHTADDHVETMLLKLARGAGARGLCGISRTASQNGIKIIRPLRDIWRRELTAWLRRHGHAWREDASNADAEFLRNRVRHAVLPIMREKLNPRIDQALWRLADIMEHENEWLESLARPIHQQCRAPAGPPALNCDLLQAYPLAARRRVLRLWLADAGVAPETLDFDTARRIESLLAPGRSGRKVNLPGGHSVRREYAFIKTTEPAARIGTTRRPRATAAGNAFEHTLKIPGVTAPAGQDWRIDCAVESKPDILDGGPDGAFISAAHWRRRRITARNWRPGDRIAPFGMSGSRKLQDVFSDLKVPADRRARLPALECGGEIIWVPGYRIARAWAVRPSDRRVLRIGFAATAD